MPSFEEEALALARELAAIKEGLRRGLDGRLIEEMDFALLSHAMLISGEDYKEGLAAVKALRNPRFSGC